MSISVTRGNVEAIQHLCPVQQIGRWPLSFWQAIQQLEDGMSPGHRTLVEMQRLERLLGRLLSGKARSFEVAQADALTGMFKVSLRLIEPVFFAYSHPKFIKQVMKEAFIRVSQFRR